MELMRLIGDDPTLNSRDDDSAMIDGFVWRHPSRERIVNESPHRMAANRHSRIRLIGHKFNLIVLTNSSHRLTCRRFRLNLNTKPAKREQSADPMERTFKSLVAESNLDSLNEHTNKLAQSIKTIISNVVVTLRQNRNGSPTPNTINDDPETCHSDQSSLPLTIATSDSSSNDNLPSNEPDDDFDWPGSFIKLLEQLSLKQQQLSLECANNDSQSSNLPLSPVSSLSIDDRDYELTIFRLNDADELHNQLEPTKSLDDYQNFDKTSLWLMDFNCFLQHQPQSILNLAPSIADNNLVLPLEWDENINSNDDRDLDDNQHDRNIVNLMKFVATTNRCDSLRHDESQRSNERSKLRRHKTLPFRFNFVTSIDLNQLKQPTRLATPADLTNDPPTTESIVHVQDFDEDEDNDTQKHSSLDRQTTKSDLNSNYKIESHTIASRDSAHLSASSVSTSSQQGDSKVVSGDCQSNGRADRRSHAAESQPEDGKYSMLQFALYNFREAIDKYSLETRAQKTQVGDTSTLKGSLKLIESLRNGTLPRDSEQSVSGDSGKRHPNINGSSIGSSAKTADWTWRELAEMVKFTRTIPKHSLLKLPSEDLDKKAVECFSAIMQYMGDMNFGSSYGRGGKHQSTGQLPQNDVDCVYLILMHLHNYPMLRDEVYCQLIKQTTNNRSEQPDSCLKGWRLFSIVAAYFDCSDMFRPYLLKSLESAAYDKRRAYCSVALLCLQNLRKTFKYGGRKNVPSIEEIAATSAGRNSKRQIYRLPGGTERVINTNSTTVVDDINHEICSNMLDISDPDEMLEFSLYCIADGDTYTMPLNRDEYILDITTELIKNHQQYFLIFCRSIWYYPLRLDSKLYIEVIFNQISPDYLEGLFLVLPHLKSLRRQHQQSSRPLKLKVKLIKEIARIAALLYRASGAECEPEMDDIKHLLPRSIVQAIRLCNEQSAGCGDPFESLNDDAGDKHHNADATSKDSVFTSPQSWMELVKDNWSEVSAFDQLDAKAQFLNIVRHWPLFGSSFFAIKLFQRDLIQPTDFILALNKFGIQMLDILTHESKHKYPFNEVISTRKVRSEDGALFLDVKCGNLMKRTIIRIQTDQAHEISRLIRQYIDIELLQQRQQPQHSTIGNPSPNFSETNNNISDK